MIFFFFSMQHNYTYFKYIAMPAPSRTYPQRVYDVTLKWPIKCFVIHKCTNKQNKFLAKSDAVTNCLNNCFFLLLHYSGYFSLLSAAFPSPLLPGPPIPFPFSIFPSLPSPPLLLSLSLSSSSSSLFSFFLFPSLVFPSQFLFLFTLSALSSFSLLSISISLSLSLLFPPLPQFFPPMG